jgi:hypothetical protein
MKKLMVALLMLAAMTSLASADFIGIFADDQGVECQAAIVAYEPLVVHVMAYIPNVPGGITAVEFSVANYPGSPGYPTGTATPAWDSDLVIGDISFDISIAFSEPQYGPFAHIGTIEFLMFDPAWIGNDHVMAVAPGNDCECLVVVDDLFEIIEVDGGIFTFNCTGTCVCLEETATQDSSWSAVKSLF